VSQADKRRRRARAAAQRALKPIVAPPSTPSEPNVPDVEPSPSTPPTSNDKPPGRWPGKNPGESGNPEQQWKPGHAPNAAGYSRGRRLADAIHRALDENGLDATVARTVVAMAIGQKIKDRSPDLDWFKELRSMIDGPGERRDVQTIAVDVANDVTVVVPVVTSDIDPAVAERILAAAEPDVTLEDDLLNVKSTEDGDIP
jgi:hypothetical protein